MTEQKWQEIKGNIQDMFKVVEIDSEQLEEDGGINIEWIIFDGPLGRMRLEFESRPMIIDKKTNYSNRIGSETAVTYTYSPHERSTEFAVFKWDEGQEVWVEYSAENFLQ
ncbi:MAG: hypothetical protein WCG01_03580 [bacterium]